jgi:hypothetical protein
VQTSTASCTSNVPARYVFPDVARTSPWQSRPPNEVWPVHLQQKHISIHSYKMYMSLRGLGARLGTLTSWEGYPTKSRHIPLGCENVYSCTDPSSHQRGRHTWKIKKVIVTQINVTSGHLLQKGQDTKTNWPIDRRSKWLRLRGDEGGTQSKMRRQCMVIGTSDLTSQRLHRKLQTRPLFREGSLQEEQQSNCH